MSTFTYTSTLYMYEYLVHCTLKNTLLMYKDNVNVHEHCKCTRTLKMYKDIVNVQGNCKCKVHCIVWTIERCTMSMYIEIRKSIFP